uniref:Caspase-3-like protein n=1 Tax=Onchidium reevesii TaxID=2547651 RepID=A0A7D5Q2T2_9EUPU|nr:caspase-3-like protein [Onchidium reevesii]
MAGRGDFTDTPHGGVQDSTDAHGVHSTMGQPSSVPAATQSKSDFVSDRYKMDHPKRGIAVIINNKDFLPQTGMGSRTGTDVDAESMHDLLNEMSFEKIIPKKNVSVKDMKELFWDVSKYDHSRSDCFVCVILTHGEEGYVYGTDGKIPIDDLVYPFKGHNCKTLAGKPKLFFIQACRGQELDGGVDVSDAIGEEEAMEEEVVIRRIPTEADFLMAYSVVPGYFAWRNSSRGSWFIQAIVSVFQANWKTMDVLTMMTRVNKKVAYDFQSNASSQSMNRKKQIPCITSMLTKDVYFTEK